MARLDTIRSTIAKIPDEAPYEGVVMDLSTRQCVVMNPMEEKPEEEWAYDDDDFWESIDLLETSIKMCEALKTESQMSPERRQLLENHIIDLKMFVGTFIVPEPEDGP